jgi:hypothetical protein
MTAVEAAMRAGSSSSLKRLEEEEERRIARESKLEV